LLFDVKVSHHSIPEGAQKRRGGGQQKPEDLEGYHHNIFVKILKFGI
jgi:hypothetical protein